MTSIQRLPPTVDARPSKSIHIGGVLASRGAISIRTVLGSCIAVCLRDPVSRVGGMNHFLLPESAQGESSSRYGIHAMELLINACMNAGAQRNRLEAKVFGGAHLLQTHLPDGGVPRANIRFALHFLEVEGIVVVRKDVGGFEPRVIHFQTDCGRVLLKRLTSASAERRQVAELLAEERRIRSQKPIDTGLTDDNVTLF